MYKVLQYKVLTQYRNLQFPVLHYTHNINKLSKYLFPENNNQTQYNLTYIGHTTPQKI